MQNIIFSESAAGLDIERLVRDQDFTMPIRHIHDGIYEIYYLLDGSRYYFVETKTYHLHKGSLIFINQNTIHKTAQIGKAYHDRILLQVPVSLLDSILPPQSHFKTADFFSENCVILALNEPEQLLIKNLLLLIKDELRDKKNDYHLIVASCLIQLFVFAQRFKELPLAAVPPLSSSPKHHTIGKIALYITENSQQPLSLKGLAEHFFLNKSYLCRTFKEVTSFTIVEYLHMQRVKKACQLLGQNSLNVSQISDAVGFENITYFERVFKKYMGVSPLKYRRQNANPE